MNEQLVFFLVNFYLIIRNFLIYFNSPTAPTEIINFMASSKFIFKKTKSFLGTKIKNPLVGFGVVGIKTLVKLSLIFGDIGFADSLVANPTAHAPGLGNSIRTVFQNRLRKSSQ